MKTRPMRSDSESDRTPARQELLRRGFSEVDLELARQLFSPDTEVRKQLALAVPRLASVGQVSEMILASLPSARSPACRTCDACSARG